MSKGLKALKLTVWKKIDVKREQGVGVGRFIIKKNEKILSKTFPFLFEYKRYFRRMYIPYYELSKIQSIHRLLRLGVPSKRVEVDVMLLPFEYPHQYLASIYYRKGSLHDTLYIIKTSFKEFSGKYYEYIIYYITKHGNIQMTTGIGKVGGNVRGKFYLEVDSFLNPSALHKKKVAFGFKEIDGISRKES